MTTTVFTTCSSDSTDATALTHSTTTTMVFSMQKTGTTTTTVSLRGQSILMLLKHLGWIHETYPPTATSIPASSTRGQVLQSAHSIFQTRIQWITTTMASPMKTLTDQGQADTTKMTTTTHELTNSSGLVTLTTMVSRTTLTTTMMAMAWMTLRTPTHTIQPSPQATQKLATSSMQRRHGTSTPTEFIRAA